jgi:hypothetical protein
MSISRISNKWVHTITLNRLRQREVFRNMVIYCDLVDLIDLIVIEEIYKFPRFQVSRFPVIYYTLYFYCDCSIIYIYFNNLYFASPITFIVSLISPIYKYNT